MPLTREALIELYGEPDDLAQDPSGKSNYELATWALDAVNAFARRSRNRRSEQHYDVVDLVEEEPGEGILGELIGDLVCDLMHLIVLCGGDPEDVVDTGARHFMAEAGRGYDDRPEPQPTIFRGLDYDEQTVTLEMDLTLAAAIGHAVCYAIEDDSGWVRRVLVDTELDAAIHRFYPIATRLAGLHENIETMQVIDFSGEPCLVCGLYLYQDDEGDWHDEHRRPHMCLPAT